MNWKEIKLSKDNHHFTWNGEKLFGRNFINALKFHAPGLAPVCDESGWYHIDVNGQPLYMGRYNRTFGFYCQRSAVNREEGCFHITEQGSRIYRQHYEWCGNYQEDICVVRNKKDQYFHIDLNGKPIYAERYTYAGDFKDGIACVRSAGGMFTHINKRGKYLHNQWFKMLGVYHKGYATALDSNGWFHISLDGTPLYAERYFYLEPFYNGVALALDQDGRQLLLHDSELSPKANTEIGTKEV